MLSLLLGCLLVAPGVLRAGDLEVRINGKVVATPQATLENAVTASRVGLSKIKNIEVFGGSFETSDWEWLRGKRDALSALTEFIISDGVTAVADVPGGNVGSDVIFGGSLERLHVAKVAQIGETAFFSNTSLRDIEFPAVTKIGMEAFGYCSALSHVSLPLVNELERGAFTSCTSLVSVSLPVVTTIAQLAFARCTSLRNLYLSGANVPSSVHESAFFGCHQERWLLPLHSSGDRLQGQELTQALERYARANDGKTDDDLWYGWRLLEGFHRIFQSTEPLHGRVLYPEWAPQGSQVSLIVKANAGYRPVLRYQVNLVGHTISDVVFTMPDADVHLFAEFEVNHLQVKVNGAQELVGISLADLLSGQRLGDITSLEIQRGHLSAWDWLWLRENRDALYALTDFTISESVSGVEDMPDSKDQDPIFGESLQRLRLPRVRRVGENAFAQCSALASVSLPAVESIGDGSFTNCTKLRSLIVPAQCPPLDNGIFNGGHLGSNNSSNTSHADYCYLYVPSQKAKEEYENAVNWSFFRPNIVVMETPTAFTVSPNPLTLRIDESEWLVAHDFTPASGPDQQMYTQVQWSSDDETIATVDTYSGEVRAIGVGTTTVKAISQANPQLIVSIPVKVPLNSFSLSLDYKELRVGDSYSLHEVSASVDPVGASNEVIWTLQAGSEDYVTLDGIRVTAKAEGSAELVATSAVDDTRVASFNLSILPKAPRMITLSPATKELRVGDAFDLTTVTVTVDPQDVSADVYWTVKLGEGTVVSLAGNEVTADGIGDAVLVATSVVDETKTAELPIHVKVKAPETLTIDPVSKEMRVGESFNLSNVTVTVEPTDASREVIWTVKPSTVGSVLLDNDEVTALREGQAVLMVTSAEDASISKEFTITVKAKAPTALAFTPASKTLTVGESFDLRVVTVNPTPTDASPVVTWSLKAGSEAFVILEDNRVTATAAGDAVLVATSVEDPGVTVELTVRVSPAPVVPPTPTSMTLSQQSHSMRVGETFDLSGVTVTVQPAGVSQDVDWRVLSGEGRVVTLDGSNVTASGVGEAVLMVSSRGHAGVYQQFTITVKAKAPTALAFTPASKALTVGESFDLRDVTVNPNPTDASPAVTWSVKAGSEAFVTLDGSQVTAKAAGDAVLVATSEEDPGVTGELTVRVSPVPAAPTSLSLSLKSHSMLVTEEFDLSTLTVTVKPEGSSQEVEWRVVSGDVSVVKLEGTKLKAMGVGTAVLMVTSRMQPGVYQHFTVTVNAKRVEDPNGKGGANPNDPTPVVADGMMLSLLPNPAPSAFRIEGVTAPAVVRIYDLRGALMHECSYGPQSGEISVAHLPAGIYLVKVNQSTLRLVIQR